MRKLLLAAAVLASLGVVSIPERASQGPAGSMQAFAADAVGHWIGLLGDERLDELGERVQTRAGRDRRRQVVGGMWRELS